MARRSAGTVFFNAKVLSVLLAVVLWIYVAGVRGPNTTKSVSAQVVATNIPQGYVLSGTMPIVNVTLQGPANTLWNINSSYITPTVDLRGRTDGAFITTVQVQLSGLSGVTVQEVDPKEVNVLLERLQTVTVPVIPEVSGTLSSNMALGAIKVDPSSIQVSGPASLVGRVKEAVLTVALDKIAVPLKGGNLTVAGDATACDSNGQAVEGVSLSPRSVIALLPLLDSSALKTVPLLPETTGYPKNGYALASAVCTPALVMVTGPASALSQLQIVKTEPMDVSTITGTVIRQTKVVLPAGVSLAGGETSVSCRIVVEPVIVLAIPGIQVSVRGASPGWKAVPETSTVSVLLSGTSSEIMGLKASQIEAYVDVSAPSLSDGGYEVLLDGLPQGIVSATVTPASIIVDIDKGQ